MNDTASPRIDQAGFFLWMRVIAGTIAAITCAMQVWTNSHDIVRWLNSLSLACFFAFYRTKQPGESSSTYLANARAIVTNCSALAVVVTGALLIVRSAR